MTDTITRATPDELHARQASLWRLYRECFSAPPWSEPEEQLAGFPDRLREQLAHPGAGGLITYDGDEVVGAVYGWPAPAHQPRDNAFDRAVADAAPPGALARMVTPALVVAELMVAASHRRRGIAAQLLAAYVATAPAAWLSTHRDSSAAAFYRRQGWREDAGFTVDGAPLLLFTWAAEPAPR
jgi:predicted N-acetyltransferase YhbS